MVNNQGLLLAVLTKINDDCARELPHFFSPVTPIFFNGTSVGEAPMKSCPLFLG